MVAAPLLYVSDQSQPETISRRIWRFEVLHGPNLGAVFEPAQSPVLVGAAPTAEIRLTDATVSRFHAEVDLWAGAVRVRDLESKNGCKVDGRRLARALIHPGGRFSVGGTALEVTAEDIPVSQPTAVEQDTKPLVHASASTNLVASWIEVLAPLDVPVCLVGPEGSGRTAWSNLLHARSQRSGAPFVFHTCGQGAPLEGAWRDAAEGTLLLTEPHRLTAQAQKELLQAIETSEPPRIVTRCGEPLYGRLIPGLAEHLGAVHLFLEPVSQRLPDRQVFLRNLLEPLGLGEPLSSLYACLAGPAQPLGFNEIESVVKQRWPPDREADGERQFRRIFLEEFMERADGDIDAVAQALGLSSAELFDELDRRKVPLPE